MSDKTTAPSWAKNRNGDPRQHLHKAEQLDTMVRMRRKHAERLREQAAAIDDVAAKLEQAAKDYRRWAGEKLNVRA